MHGQPLVHADEPYPLAFRSPAPYSRSKALAELVVLEESRDGLEAMIVRPRFVWGRGDTTLLPLLVEGAHRRFRWVGGGRQLTSTTHVDNTVEGLIAGRRARPRRPRLLHHRRRAGRLPRLRRRPDRHPGGHAPYGERPTPLARRSRRWGDGLEAVAAARRAAADPLRLLGRLPGVHARRPPRPRGARLRAGDDARGGDAGAARRGLSAPGGTSTRRLGRRSGASPRPRGDECHLDHAMGGRIHPVDATPSVLVERSEGVVRGYRWVRPDERERIVVRLGTGGSSRELALEFGCSTRTVLRIGEQAALAGRRVAHSRRWLSFEERERISRGIAAGESDSEIARALGRHRSTVGREIRAACAERGAIGRWRPSASHGRVARGPRRPSSRPRGGCWRRSRPALSGAGRPSRSRPD